MLPTAKPARRRAAAAERSTMAALPRVSMDIGGTFTDVVAYDEERGTYTAGKASTTPRDLTEGVFAGLGQVIDSPASIGFTVHGTTVGPQRVPAAPRREGAAARDRGRGRRLPHRPRQPRRASTTSTTASRGRSCRSRDIVEIPGRLDWLGEERAPLDEAAVRAAAARVRDEGFGAVAVALPLQLPQPGPRAARRGDPPRGARRASPISLSHRVAREWREYERTSSAVVEAYTAPVIRALPRAPAGARWRPRASRVPLHVMQSSGGVVTAESARERPLQTLLSGPGRRDDGPRRARAHARPAEPDRRRHGRHELRRQPRRRRQAGRLDRDLARGLPAADADRRTSTRSARAAARSPTPRPAACASGPRARAPIRAPPATAAAAPARP